MAIQACRQQTPTASLVPYVYRSLTEHKISLIPYQGSYYFDHHPTTSLFVFFKNFTEIGRSSSQVMFIGLEPVCVT